MKKRILIDGRFIGEGESIARYVLELTKEILKLDKENDYTLLIRPIGEREVEQYPEIINAENLKIDVLDIPHYSVAEQTKLLKYLNREKYDLVHFTQFNHPVLYKRPFVVTIHDLTLVGHLHYFNFIKRLAYNLVMSTAAKKSKKIIAISEFTKKDVIDYFKVSEDKFEVIYHGLDFDKFSPNIPNKEQRIKEFKEEYKIAEDYFLYVGAWKKHKNLLRLLKAYYEFAKGKDDSIPQLVLVGKNDPKEPEIKTEIDCINERLKKQVNKAIVLTGPVDIRSDKLPIIYSGALAYIIPSLSEGFGWPPLEAMATGKIILPFQLDMLD